LTVTAPQFPPLFRGEELSGNADPVERARALAISGTDPGLVVYTVSQRKLRASIIFAPEMALQDAVAALPACGVGFQNALGSLAPPEVAVHLEWNGIFRVNGAQCGHFSIDASTREPTEEPDWLIVSLDLVLQHDNEAPGINPDYTALIEEGCSEVDPIRLLESWVRHTLYWVNRWSEDGISPLHSEWRGLAHNIGETVTLLGQTGTFVGVDENFGALIRDANATHLLPLTALLKG